MSLDLFNRQETKNDWACIKSLGGPRCVHYPIHQHTNFDASWNLDNEYFPTEEQCMASDCFRISPEALQNPDLVSLMSEYLDMQDLANLARLDPATKTMTERQRSRRELAYAIVDDVFEDPEWGAKAIKDRILLERESKRGFTPGLIDILDILVSEFISLDLNSELAMLSDPIILEAVKQLFPERYGQFVWASFVKYNRGQFLRQLDLKDKEWAHRLTLEKLGVLIREWRLNAQLPRNQLGDAIDFVEYYLDIHPELALKQSKVDNMLVSFVLAMIDPWRTGRVAASDDQLLRMDKLLSQVQPFGEVLYMIYLDRLGALERPVSGAFDQLLSTLMRILIVE